MSAPDVITLELHRLDEASDPFAFAGGDKAYALRRDGPPAVATLSWDALLPLLHAVRRPAPDAEALRRLGEAQRRFLLTLGVDLTALVSARELTLRFAAAELFQLPWEATVLDESGATLAERGVVSPRYAWPGAHAAPEGAAALPEGGRVLLAWSGAVPHEAQAALLGAQEALELVTLPEATAGALSEALEGVDALHLLCHGARQGHEVGLELGGFVGVEALRRLLAPRVERLRLVVLLSCRSAEASAPDSALGSVALALHRAGVEAVVASRLDLSFAAAQAFTEAFYGRLALDGVEGGLSAARSSLLGQGGAPHLALQLYAHSGSPLRPLRVCPYPGLAAFAAREARWFHGRHAEIAEVRARLEAGGPVVVLGPSGSGKSSMVSAGVLPQVRLRAARLTPGQDPMGALERALGAEPELLFVDQLEELATHGVAAGAQQAFLDAAFAAGLPLVFALRSDFLEATNRLRVGERSFAALAFAEGLRLEPLGEEELLTAIEAPAASVGLTVEPGVARAIVSAVEGEPGALPLVQHCLRRLWEGRSQGRLTAARYAALGGVEGSIRAHADAVMAGFSEDEQRAAWALMLKLVSLAEEGARDTRRWLGREALLEGLDGEVGARVLDRLLAERLLVSGGGAHPAVSLIHDTLLRTWPALADEVQAHRAVLAKRRTLERWAEEWEAGRRGLLHGPALADAIEVGERLEGALGARAAEYLRQSRRAAGLSAGTEGLPTGHPPDLALAEGLVLGSLALLPGYALLGGWGILVVSGAVAWVQARRAGAGPWLGAQVGLTHGLALSVVVLFQSADRVRSWFTFAQRGLPTDDAGHVAGLLLGEAVRNMLLKPQLDAFAMIIAFTAAGALGGGLAGARPARQPAEPSDEGRLLLGALGALWFCVSAVTLVAIIAGLARLEPSLVKLFGESLDQTAYLLTSPLQVGLSRSLLLMSLVMPAVLLLVGAVNALRSALYSWWAGQAWRAALVAAPVALVGVTLVTVSVRTGPTAAVAVLLGFMALVPVLIVRLSRWDRRLELTALRPLRGLLLGVEGALIALMVVAPSFVVGFGLMDIVRDIPMLFQGEPAAATRWFGSDGDASGLFGLFAVAILGVSVLFALLAPVRLWFIRRRARRAAGSR